jgi:beta-1,4-mannooligosaccharide/beta-1,4-mannosyl-N-acetylglucosamine phosphorylase
MKKVGLLQESSIVQRYPGNPILRAEDLPYPSKLVYNAGVVRHEGRYTMVFRTDSGWDPETKKAPEFNLGLAFSEDGIDWRVHPDKLHPDNDPDIRGSNDPRLMWMEDRFFLTYSQLTWHGNRVVIAATRDFQQFEILDRTVPDNRDVVLFPEKINGKYYRLERPFPIDSRDKQRQFDIWISESPDLVYWGRSQPLLCLEDIPYANERLGAGSPPIRTDAGWLVLFHAVDVDEGRGKNGWEDQWQSRYTAGVLLLDLHDPRQVIAASKDPLMVPGAAYEVNGGFRNNVVFPTALVPEENGEAKIYYGAADTFLCLATARIEELVAFCLTYR